MKTLWQFGDSFTAPQNPQNWGYKLSKKLKIDNFEQRGRLGHSNYQILTEILKDLDNIKPDDMVLVNWSYLTRGTIVLKPTDLEANILSTNRFFNDESLNFNGEDKLGNDEAETFRKFAGLINDVIQQSLQFNSLIFYQFKLIQDLLERRGCKKVYSVFLEKENLYWYNEKLPWPDDSFGLNELNFKNKEHSDGYWNFLKENWYLGDSDIDIHYKYDISDTIADHYLELINPKNTNYII